MSDRQVRDEVLTIFLAGHETTAIALTWAFCLLAENPDAEGTLRAEVAHVRTLAGSAAEGEVTEPGPRGLRFTYTSARPSAKDLAPQRSRTST